MAYSLYFEKELKLDTCFSFACLEFLQQGLVEDACVILYPQHNELCYKSSEANKPSPSTVRHRSDLNFHLNFLDFFAIFSILSHDCGFSWNFFKRELRDLIIWCSVALSLRKLRSKRANFRWRKFFFRWAGKLQITHDVIKHPKTNTPCDWLKIWYDQQTNYRADVIVMPQITFAHLWKARTKDF